MTMMFSLLISGLMGFIFFSSTVDAAAKESIEVKVFDPSFKISDHKMLEMLEKVDLESHGYKKEVTTKLVSEPGRSTPVYRKSFLYYKIVNCSRLGEIDQELETLLPANIFGAQMTNKINSEIISKDLTKMKQCKVGLQIHFKSSQGCPHSNNPVRRRKRACFGFCVLCWCATLTN